MASKDTLQRQVEKLKEQADAIDKACWPRGVFMREDQSEEDAVRGSGLMPGEKFFLFRWQTEQEQREYDQAGMTETELNAALNKGGKDVKEADQQNVSAHSAPEDDQQHCGFPGDYHPQDGA